MAESKVITRRRSQRLHIENPVLVYGHGPDQEPFYEETHTICVNAHGGRLVLARKVNRDQKLLLTNPNTGAIVECRVSSLDITEQGENEVGVEFLTPAPKFWSVSFPPEDWDPADRKRPQPRSS